MRKKITKTLSFTIEFVRFVCVEGMMKKKKHKEWVGWVDKRAFMKAIDFGLPCFGWKS